MWTSIFTIWDLTVKPPRKITVTDPTPSANVVTVSLSNGVAFSPDGKTLATADGSTYSAYLWDVTTGHRIGVFTDANSKGVGDVAYTPDGKTLITADGNGSIYLWDIATGRTSATLTNPGS